MYLTIVQYQEMYLQSYNDFDANLTVVLFIFIFTAMVLTIAIGIPWMLYYATNRERIVQRWITISQKKKQITIYHL